MSTDRCLPVLVQFARRTLRHRLLSRATQQRRQPNDGHSKSTSKLHSLRSDSDSDSGSKINIDGDSDSDSDSDSYSNSDR